MRKKFIFWGIVILVFGILFFYNTYFYFSKNIYIDKVGGNATINGDGFRVNEVYQSKEFGDIHYSVYVPDSYNKKNKYNLYITLPGYEGLYFQGVGKNIELEDFAREAKKINPNMIIVAPQLNDWGKMSANQTIALIEYFKDNYNIDKVFANGYSGGGETMSLVLGKRADLIDAYLQVSSKWDGDLSLVVKNKVPVYLVIGENDEYYGSSLTKNTYEELYSMYIDSGLERAEINKLLILDIKDHDYFTSQGINNEHAGGGLIAHDRKIMGWLLNVENDD